MCDGNETAITCGDPAGLAGDDFKLCTFGFKRGLQFLQQRAVCTVAGQHPHLASGETRRGILQDAEGGRGRQIPRRHGSVRRVRQRFDAEFAGHPFGQRAVDVEQMRHHAFADHRHLAFRQLEDQRVCNVLLLHGRLAQVELPRLAVMIGKALRAQALLGALHLRRIGADAGYRIFARPFTPGIRLIIGPSPRIVHGHVPVLLEMREGAFGGIDRDVGEVRAAKPFQLGVEIGEVAPLQQRIIGKADPRRDILRHEGDLFGFGEEVVRHPVEDQPSHRDRREDFLRNDLGRIQHVEIETICKILVEQLQAELPFRELSGSDGLPEVAAMEIRIGAVDLQRLVPKHRLHAGLRLPDELDEG